MSQPDRLLKISPVSLADRKHISHVRPLNLVCLPVSCQNVVTTCLLELLTCHAWHLVLIDYGIEIITLGEHYLVYVEFMLVQGVIATCHHLETVFQLVAVHIREKPAVSNVVWWNLTEKPSVIEILERFVPARSEHVRVRIHQLTNQLIRLVNLLQHLCHRASRI